jgi:tetratricopeptide (TPR) repeat protein
LTQFYYHLSLEPGTKVVIWDSVDYASDLIEFADSLLSTQSLYIIITSRNAILSQKFAKDTGYIQLSDLSTSESIALLGGTANDALRAVAEQLGGLPLAIIQAASYMRRHHISPLEYELLLDQAQDRKQEDFSNFTYNTALSHTIAISLDHLQTADALAFKILSFVSILDASHIPKYLLTHLSPDFVPLISMVDLDRSIASLRNYSLVQLTQDQSCLDLHRIVQDAIRRRLYQKGDIALWENAALRAISHEFPRGDFQEWEKCSELLPHALVVLEYDVAKDNENCFHRYELLQHAGTYVMETGRYALSGKLLQEAYIVSMKQYGLDSMESQSVATLLAQLFLLMGRLEEAKNLEGQVLQFRKMTLGPDHPDTLASMGNLASIYRNQGRWEMAEELEVGVMDRSLRVLGQEHLDTLTSMANLASTYGVQGRWKEAEQLDVQVLETRERVLGHEHPDVLTSVDNLASLLRYQGKYEQAEEMNRRALEGREKVLGKEHPDTLTSVSNLASVLQYQGKYEQAEEMDRRALEGREKMLGKEHPDMLTSVSNLASVLQYQGKYEQAEEMNRRALEGREKVLGKEHPDTLTSVYYLAYLLHQQGQYQEALLLYQRATTGYEKTLGLDHPITKACLQHSSLLQPPPYPPPS